MPAAKFRVFRYTFRMWRLLLIVALLSALSCSSSAQWHMQDSHTSADLRGVHSIGNGIAWANGTNGTVLRTADDGEHWQLCATPSGAEALDFRGIQGFDANTAIVMSSGKGNLSRLYKTTDGCRTWNLVFTNPDAPDGSFKAIQFAPGIGRENGRAGGLIGDPVSGKFAEYRTNDYGKSWQKSERAWQTSAEVGEVLFAASNSSFLRIRGWTLFVTGGSVTRSRTLEEHVKHDPSIAVRYVGGDLPLVHGVSAGAASVAAHLGPDSVADSDAAKYIVRAVHVGDALVVVGGDYQQPDKSVGTCAVSTDGSLHWSASKTLPHGYRSAVAYDAPNNTWITVGPNGTDISADDGRIWRSLTPNHTDTPDADKNWNALSLPFAVGPKGRIGKLRTEVLKP
jgi:hypothetical protein